MNAEQWEVLGESLSEAVIRINTARTSVGIAEAAALSDPRGSVKRLRTLAQACDRAIALLTTTRTVALALAESAAKGWSS